LKDPKRIAIVAAAGGGLDNPSMFNGCFYGTKERFNKMKNMRTNKFNLSFFCFERPKNNRRMKSSGDSVVVSVKQKRD